MNQDEKLQYGVQNFLDSQKALESARAAVVREESTLAAAERELARRIKACGHELIVSKRRCCVLRFSVEGESPELVVETIRCDHAKPATGLTRGMA